MNFEKYLWIIIKFVSVFLIAILLSFLGLFLFYPIASIILSFESPSFPAGNVYGVAFLGTIMSFAFVFTLMSAICLRKYKSILLALILIFELLIIFIISGSRDFLTSVVIKVIFVAIITNIAGWLIGEGIMLGWKKIKGGK